MGTGTWILIIFLVLFVVGMIVVSQIAGRFEKKLHLQEKEANVKQKKA